MAKEAPGERGAPKTAQLRRTFEHSADALSFYSDFVSLAVTEHEAVLQFFETLPRPDPNTGDPSDAATRLRVSIVMSLAQLDVLTRILVRKGERAAAAAARPATKVESDR